MRLLDFMAAAIGLIIFSPIMLILYVIGLFDTGSPIFCQQRVGRSKEVFTLFKFRTMKIDTVSAPTHETGANSVTKYGNFLRRSKLDELPQLINVLKGDMSLVGPRPCLPIQQELIDARSELGVYRVRPGITGLAQINRIDMSNPKLLANTDWKMIETLNVTHYIKYILMTLLGRGIGDNVNR